MKKLRIATVLILTSGLPIAFVTGPKTVGFDVNSVDGRSLVRAGSDPVMIVWSLIAIPFFAYLVTRRDSFQTVSAASWTRRFRAFLIDFYTVSIAVAPLVGIVPLLFEATRTGRFTWGFERHFTVPADWYLAVSLWGVVTLIVVGYFTLAVARGTPTIGCYLLGLKLRSIPSVAHLGLSRGLRRVTLSFVGLCAWPVLRLLGRGDDGSTWYDRLTGFRVDRVNYQ